MNKKIFSLRNLIHFVGIFIFIFIFILFKIDIKKSLEIIAGSNPFLIIIALVAGIPPIILRNLRWQKLLKNKGVIIKFSETFLVYFYAVFWGSITPGKIGEFSKIIYLNKKGVPLKISTVSVIFDRLFDIITILILGFLGLFIFFRNLKNIIYIFLIIGMIILSFIFILYFNKNFIKNTLEKIISKLPIKNSSNVSEEIIDNLFNSLKKPGFILFSGTIISIAAWVMYFFQLYILSKAIGINLAFILTSAIIAIITTLNLIPITVSGIGTRDLTLMLLFSQIGLGKEEAISFSMMILLTFVAGGLFGWICGFFLEKHPPQMS